MKSNNILFLTNMFPIETALHYEKGFIQGGENITYIQKSIIDGLYKISNSQVKVINKLLLGKPSKFYVKKTTWETDSVLGINFSFLNIPFFSSNLLHIFAKRQLKVFKKDTLIVLAYGLTNCNLKLLMHMKKINPLNKVAVIVPDIPEDTKNNGSFLQKIKNKFTNYITNKLINKSISIIDEFILFSSHMASRIHCETKYMVLEGISTDSYTNIKPKRIVPDGCFQIFYGGGIHKKYGADVLLKSIKEANEKFIFVLCGTGDYVNEIIESNLSNVIYLGRVARTELLSLICGSDVLINPRTSEGSFSKYSFPSKNMEYLSSGIPFVGFKLDGIPNEYDELINYPEEETPFCFLSKIQEVCLNKDLYKVKALKARDHVLMYKNKYAQAERIMDSLK